MQHNKYFFYNNMYLAYNERIILKMQDMFRG
jgi:hypothetical protein